MSKPIALDDLVPRFMVGNWGGVWTGKNVLGFDAGKLTGWTILNIGGKRPGWICSGIAKEFSNRPNDPRTGVWRLTDALQRLHAEYSIAFIAIESVRNVYGRERFGPRMATALLRAARVEERILAAASALGIPTETCTAREARGAIGWKSWPGKTADARVKLALASVVKLPPSTCNHERDAAVAALCCARRAAVVQMQKTNRQPNPTRTQ